MKTIKFRGLRTDGGGYAYGDLTHDRGHSFINDWRVLETSVDQFLGLDNNGDEIYEGDMLVDKNGGKYRPELTVNCYGKFSSGQQAILYSPHDTSKLFDGLTRRKVLHYETD